jgi:hypothetical protein
MNLPSPPTDNLYKFISIFFLALTLAALYAAKDISAGQDRARYEHELTYAKAWADLDHWNRDISDLRGSKTPRPEELRQAIEKRHETQLRGDEDRYRHGVWLAWDRQESARCAWCLALAAFFFLCALGGFVLWWHRYQKLADALLRAKAASAAKAALPPASPRPHPVRTRGAR